MFAAYTYLLLARESWAVSREYINVCSMLTAIHFDSIIYVAGPFRSYLSRYIPEATELNIIIFENRLTFRLHFICESFSRESETNAIASQPKIHLPKRIGLHASEILKFELKGKTTTFPITTAPAQSANCIVFSKCLHDGWKGSRGRAAALLTGCCWKSMAQNILCETKKLQRFIDFSGARDDVNIHFSPSEVCMKANIASSEAAIPSDLCLVYDAETFRGEILCRASES